MQNYRLVPSKNFGRLYSGRYRRTRKPPFLLICSPSPQFHSTIGYLYADPPCLGSCSFQFFPDWSVDSFGSWVQSKQASLVTVWPMFHVLSTSKDKDLMGYQNPFEWTYFDWFFPPRVHTHSTISKFKLTRLNLFCPQTLWCYSCLWQCLKGPLPPISMFCPLPSSQYTSCKCQP